MDANKRGWSVSEPVSELTPRERASEKLECLLCLEEQLIDQRSALFASSSATLTAVLKQTPAFVLLISLNVLWYLYADQYEFNAFIVWTIRVVTLLCSAGFLGAVYFHITAPQTRSEAVKMLLDDMQGLDPEAVARLPVERPLRYDQFETWLAAEMRSTRAVLHSSPK
jgi:hypothetical protein